MNEAGHYSNTSFDYNSTNLRQYIIQNLLDSIIEGSKILKCVQNKAEASLHEIKSMLTFCIRGERFCDGHVASVIESGKMKSILMRLKVMMEEID